MGGFAGEAATALGPEPALVPAPTASTAAIATRATRTRLISETLRHGMRGLGLSIRSSPARPAGLHLDHERRAPRELVHLPGDRGHAQALAPATRRHTDQLCVLRGDLWPAPAGEHRAPRLVVPDRDA